MCHIWLSVSSSSIYYFKYQIKLRFNILNFTNSQQFFLIFFQDFMIFECLIYNFFLGVPNNKKYQNFGTILVMFPGDVDDDGYFY